MICGSAVRPRDVAWGLRAGGSVPAARSLRSRAGTRDHRSTVVLGAGAGLDVLPLDVPDPPEDEPELDEYDEEPEDEPEE